MEPRELPSLARDCGGTLTAADQTIRVRRVCTDSRAVQPGDLFVCLRGTRFDGHAYAIEAVRQGAVAVLGEAAALEGRAPDAPCILVPDSRAALGRLAAAHRARYEVPVVAVAGSNGKTTTKELLAAVLRQRGPVVASPASFNNDIGVPLTLLELESRHWAAVVEVGTNHPGELPPLLELARPTHAVLTRLGREHLEFFGDLEGVIREESTVADALPVGGVLALVGESPGADTVMRRARCRVVRAGWAPENDWQAVAACVSEAGACFEVRAGPAGYSGEYHLPLLGRHQVENALLALALGAELGLSRAELSAGLASARPAPRRLCLSRVNGVLVLDDSYNANPDSMRAALETLRDLDCPGRRIAVLGDMSEQGAHAAAGHREVGRAAAAAGVTHLLAVGRWAGELCAGARAGGLERCECFAQVADAAEAVVRLAQPGDLVLIKASRAARLDVVADVLLRTLAAREERPAAARGTLQKLACFTP